MQKSVITIHKPVITLTQRFSTIVALKSVTTILLAVVMFAGAVSVGTLFAPWNILRVTAVSAEGIYAGSFSRSDLPAHGIDVRIGVRSDRNVSLAKLPAVSDSSQNLSTTSIPVSFIDGMSLSAMPVTDQQRIASALLLRQNGTGLYPDRETAIAVWHTSANAALDNTSLEKAFLSYAANSRPGETNTGQVVLSIRNYSENRQAIVDAVIRTFGIRTNTYSVSAANISPAELIAETAFRTGTIMQYDWNYRCSDMMTSLKDARGVCQQYSIIAYILLNAEGVPTRRVHGTLTVHRADGTTLSGYHAWNLSYVDGSWIPVDFTPYAGGTPNVGIVPSSRLADYCEETD